MTSLLEKVKRYFAETPTLKTSFQLTSSYLSGVRFSPKPRKCGGYFIFPLSEGIVEPSFDRKNVKDAAALEGILRQGMEKINLSEASASFLIPEACLKIFVLTFDHLPPSTKEREELIRWQVKKRIPLLPEDLRMVFSVIKSENSQKVLVCLARVSIIKEYEDFFSQQGIKIGAIGVSTLNLFQILKKEAENVLIANIEEDCLSLMAVVNSEINLYRLKTFFFDSRSSSFVEKLSNVLMEIENTTHFIEDKEKRKVGMLFLRLGFLTSRNDVLSSLEKALPFPCYFIEPPHSEEIPYQDRLFLAPLLSQF